MRITSLLLAAAFVVASCGTTSGLAWVGSNSGTAATRTSSTTASAVASGSQTSRTTSSTTTSPAGRATVARATPSTTSTSAARTTAASTRATTSAATPTATTASSSATPASTTSTAASATQGQLIAQNTTAAVTTQATSSSAQVVNAASQAATTQAAASQAAQATTAAQSNTAYITADPSVATEFTPNYAIAKSLQDAASRSRRAPSERRQAKNLAFIAALDSLVSSNNYQFVPTSMQEMPGGSLQFIYNFYYYVAVVENHVEVHIPTIRGGFVQYIEILNFDTFSVTNYRTSRTHFGWAISFNVSTSSDNNYAFAINVYTATGEAEMNLMTTGNVIKYIGRLEKI